MSNQILLEHTISGKIVTFESVYLAQRPYHCGYVKTKELGVVSSEYLKVYKRPRINGDFTKQSDIADILLSLAGLL